MDLNDRNVFRQIRLFNGCSTFSINKLARLEFSFEGNEVIRGWAQYFQSLSTPSWDSNVFDVDNLLSVESQISDLLLQYDISVSDVVVSPAQVGHAIKSLSTKKAAGPDHLTAEHFLNGPSDALCSLLAPLFSAMINRHYVPPSFTVSYIIPLLKGKSLDPTNPNNYRGITHLFNL